MTKKKPKTNPVDVEALRIAFKVALAERDEALNKLDAIREALVRLFELKLEATPEHFKKNYGYSKGDEDAPFFSEVFLYALLGKSDARTILAMMRPLTEAVDLDRF